MERKRLIQCPEFEKVEIATYLTNTLSLNQLLAIEDLARSGKLKRITGVNINNKNLGEESTKATTPEKSIRGQRLRHVIID